MHHPAPQVTTADLAITGFGPRTFPLLAETGEEAILALDPATGDARDVLVSALTMCFCWGEIADRGRARAWLHRAVATFAAESLIALNDVALASPELLSDAGDVLESAWQSVCDNDPTTTGNIALEGWLRLTLGGWCESSLGLRNTLRLRANGAVRGEVSADTFLVRALGAAHSQWSDRDLETAMESLSSQEDVECDLAFELGMVHLRRAVEAIEPAGAVDHLSLASSAFDRANLEGPRPDAVAFGTASEAVGRFLQGETVRADEVARVRSAASEWHLGYLGLPPHWRQARADTAGRWSELVDDLHRISDLHESAWLNATQLLVDVGRIYVSHNSCQLIASPTRATGTESTIPPAVREPDDPARPAGGVALALRPRLDAGLAATATARTLVDRWLSSSPEELSALGAGTEVVAAVAAARDRVRSAPPPPPGKAPASRDDWLPAPFREALQATIDGPAAYADLVDALEPHAEALKRAWPRLAGALLTRDLNLAQDAVLRLVLTELQALQPVAFERWQLHLNRLLSVLLRAASFAIDQGQRGDRTMPWHSQVATDRTPPEHLLADELKRLLEFDGLVSAAEVRDVGGGRSDLLIVIDSERFVIEVKRVEGASWTDDRLVEVFGTQAAQYQMTGAPFAFLAVLDATPKPSRIDLATSFWTRPWTHEQLESSPPWGLVGMRILSDVVPPSQAK